MRISGVLNGRCRPYLLHALLVLALKTLEDLNDLRGHRVCDVDMILRGIRQRLDESIVSRVQRASSGRR